VNEQFGVEELAREIGVSRSQLHRRLNTLTGQSTSQLIREYRLNKARELLENESATAAEVAYLVGFGSPSYFNTCFHEYFGYPPGEVKIRKSIEQKRKPIATKKKLLISLSIMILLAMVYSADRYFVSTPQETEPLILNRSIAVIPFIDISPDRTQQYFTDGIMNAITNNLVKIKEIKVIPTPVMQFQNSEKTNLEIGKELGVSFVLEGSVARYGDTVRITMQLIDVTTGYYSWSYNYDHPLKDIMAMQSDVAKDVAKTLQIEISPLEQKILAIRPEVNPEAYDLYLKGVASPFTSDGMYQAKKFYHMAIELEPNFSLAHTGLGSIYCGLAQFSAEIPTVFWTESLKELKRAIELDSLNGWAFASLANVMHNWEWKLEDTRQVFEKAVRLSPNDHRVHTLYQQFFWSIQDYEGTRKERIIISELNPVLGPEGIKSLVSEGNYSEAVQVAAKPGFHHNWVVDWTEAQALIALGEYESGIALLEKSALKAGKFLDLLAYCGYAYAISGDHEQAIEIKNQLMDASKVRHVPKIYFAYIHMGFGEYEQAYEYIDQSFEENDFRIHWMPGTPIFDPIKSDSRFKDIVRRSWK